MKAFPYITDHYRTGIHTISAVWTTLSIRYGDIALTEYHRRRGSKFQFGTPDSQYSQPMVGILAAAQVGHCMSSVFGSHNRREGQTPLAERAIIPSRR